jgi:frataxin-like iron-binding protein CyaY
MTLEMIDVCELKTDSIHSLYEWLKDFDQKSQLELDIDEGILHIFCKDNTEYVIKQDDKVEQLILSSPLSGVSSFSYDPHSQHWYKNDGTTLDVLIKSELTTKGVRS